MNISRDQRESNQNPYHVYKCYGYSADHPVYVIAGNAKHALIICEPRVKRLDRQHFGNVESLPIIIRYLKSVSGVNVKPGIIDDYHP